MRSRLRASSTPTEDATPLCVGLDVSQKETETCVLDAEGCRVWRGKCPSRPEAIAEALGQRAPDAAKAGMETGPLAIRLWHGLRALGVPVERLHAQHVAAALSLRVNKTDANNAHGIAQVVRSGWYRAVAVKGLESCRVRAILSARRQLVMVRTGLSNQIRGLLKTFGVVLGPGAGGIFERAVHSQCPDDPMVRDAVGALLAAWKAAGERKAELERRLVRLAREQDVCRRLATVPGVGAIASLAFVTAIDDPARFRRLVLRRRGLPRAHAEAVPVGGGGPGRTHLEVGRPHGAHREGQRREAMEHAARRAGRRPQGEDRGRAEAGHHQFDNVAVR